ncbi:MAG: MaoC family dehydratase [Myxococcales bacterium]|nr:MaoC family dehydratase [Myxococcales bacterium]
MGTNAENAAEIFQKFVGKQDEPGEWFTIDQDRINQFADCTIDHQFIHVDPEQAAKLSPYKVPIAHGFLTLSMLTHLATSVKASFGAEPYAGIMMGVNYGFEKVRFPNPVKVNSKIRMVRELAGVELKNPNTIHLIQKCTIEIDGESKPACVAEWITRLMYA